MAAKPPLKNVSPNFRHGPTAVVDVAVLGLALSNTSADWPEMVKYGIPDFMYEKTRVEDRPIPSQLDMSQSLFLELAMLGGDKRFKQSLMEQAWNFSFLDIFKKKHNEFFVLKIVCLNKTDNASKNDTNS